MKSGKAAALAVMAAVLIAAAGCPIGLLEFDDPKTVTVKVDEGVEAGDINLREYLSEPVAGATPALSFAAPSFVGIVKWKTAAGGAVSGLFAANTAYTAEVSLHSLEGHTFTGALYRYGERELSPLPGGTEKRVALEIDGFQTGELPSGGGPQATEPAATKPEVVTDLDLTDKVPAPVADDIPAVTVISGEYIGTVQWDPVSASFAKKTIYTATVTLYAQAGYTFEGIPEKPDTTAVTGAFFHDGAETVTHGQGKAGKPLGVSAVFPETGPETVQFPVTPVFDSRIADGRLSFSR